MRINGAVVVHLNVLSRVDMVATAAFRELARNARYQLEALFHRPAVGV